MVNKITLKCTNCNKEFQRYPSYITARQKLGTVNFYCSKPCAGKHKKPPGCPPGRQPNAGKRSPHPEFRRLVARTKANRYVKQNRKTKRVIEATIGVKDVIALWELQEGKCAISGLAMVLKTEGEPVYNQASIDRIDPNGGYTQGNVRLICLIANYALNRFSDDDLRTLCNAVAGYRTPH